MEKCSVYTKLKGSLFAWVLRLQRLTWRVCFQGREQLDRLYSTKNRFLICFWLGKYTCRCFPCWKGTRPVLSAVCRSGEALSPRFAEISVTKAPRYRTDQGVGRSPLWGRLCQGFGQVVSRWMDRWALATGLKPA